MYTLRVLYEDNHCCVVLKPAGMLVEPDGSPEVSLVDYVRMYLKKTYNKEGNVFVGIVHRLDKPVSGLVVFAKTSKGASRLSAQFRERSVIKEYCAFLEGNIEPKKGRQVLYMRKDDSAHKAITVSVPRAGFQRAETDYELISSSEGESYVNIRLHTGRYHQIRATFGFLGFPIVGDTKYGSTKEWHKRGIALCAHRLCFKKPTGDELVDITLSESDRFLSL